MHFTKNNQMKNKNGFLLGEFTLKTIIAVISLVLLLYLLFSIYSSFTTNKNILAAEGVIDKLKEGRDIALERGSFSYTITSPKNWEIVPYSEAFVGNCIGNCICICEKEGFIDSQLKKCSSKKTGLCDNLEIKLEGNLNIKSGIDIEIKKEGGDYVLKKI